MRVLVTGATGFVGRWLVPELAAAGHEVVSTGRAGRVEVTDASAISEWIASVRPDAVIHLATMAAPRAVEADLARALSVAVQGTANVVSALGQGRPAGSRPILLVAGSGQIYGNPDPAELPLTENSPLRPRTLYAVTKLAQEGIALSQGARAGLRVIATRSFNHLGPGQSSQFAVAAFAERIRAAQASGAGTIPVGNLDVRRDMTDVRDVVVAYRRLVEAAGDGTIDADGLVVNVASGRSVVMRDVLSRLATLAGVVVEPAIEAELVRDGEPPEVCADISRIVGLTGWHPTIDLDTTLRDVLAAAGSPTVQPS